MSLTPTQADYFATLERMDISPKFRKQIEVTKAELRLENQRAESTSTTHGGTMNPIQIARVCHEANRAIQIETDDPAVSPSWDDAPEWQRQSAIEGVEKALQGATPKELHEAWCQFKIAEGWVLGPVKDAEAKTHPCLIDYADLPQDQLLKDYVFSALVTVLSS